jgi:hypothetical protein
LVGPQHGPISIGLLGGAYLSWPIGIVVSVGVYLALSKRVTSPAPLLRAAQPVTKGPWIVICDRRQDV